MVKKGEGYSVDVKPGEKVVITKTNKRHLQKRSRMPVRETMQKSDAHLEKAMVENLIALQKINVGMTEKFDKLASEISQLLALFEVAARSFAKNTPAGDYEKDKEFLEKIDRLLDQNKVLAKGLTLMEERLREKMYTGAGMQRQMSMQSTQTQQQPKEEPERVSSIGRPLPKF